MPAPNTQSAKAQPWISILSTHGMLPSTKPGEADISKVYRDHDIRLHAQIDMHGTIRLAGMADLKG